MKTFLNIGTGFSVKDSVNKKTGEITKVTVCKAVADYDDCRFPIPYAAFLGLPSFYPNRPYKAITVAKCNPEDTFIPEYAKRLASTRARIKCYKKYKKDIKEAIKETKREYEFLNNLLQSVDNVIQNEQIYEQDLLINEDVHKGKLSPIKKKQS